MKLNVKNELLDQKNFNWRQIFSPIIATFCFLLCFSVLPICSYARSAVWDSLFYQLPSVHTVRITPQKEWKQQYVYDLDANSDLDILLSFDELFADSRQLYFVVRHCDVEWQPDDMLTLEYWDGFEKQYDCSEYMLSFNTTVDYVHYIVRIPVRKFKVSGNYTISVYSMGDDEHILTRPVIIAEHEMGIESCVRKTNNNGMQDLTVTVHKGLSNGSSKSLRDISVCSWQNNDMSSLLFFDNPTIVRGDDMSYTDPLVFQGGSEWRWADTRSLRGHVLSDTRVSVFDGYYHAEIPLATVPLGYSYHEDFNGLQYIHNYDEPKTNFDITADYSIIHINLHEPAYRFGRNSSLYVVGDFNDAPFPMNRNKFGWVEEWNASESNFVLEDYTYLVKQSLANYRIVEVDAEGRVDMTNTEASFSETENDYHICVYYRDPSTGYYRVLAYKKHNTLKTPNAFIH